MARGLSATLAFLVVAALFFPVGCVARCNGSCHSRCQTLWGLTLPGGTGLLIGVLAGGAAAFAVFKIGRPSDG